MKFRIRSQKGFTLIELVIVIMIIGILAVIGIARFIDLSHAAKIAECKSNQQHLITAQKLYWVHSSVYDGEGRYATSIDMLAPLMSSGEIPECPEDGTYQIIQDLDIQCSLADHAI